MVDPLGEIVVLNLDLRLVEVDVPGAPRRAPAIAPGLQEVFQLLRCPFSPEPHGGLPGGLQQGRQRQRAGELQRPGEQRQQGVAVVDRAVAAVEKPAFGQQIAELHALVTLGAPRDLVAAAAPVLVAEHRPARLAHLPVEAGVVGDDHRRIGGDPRDRGIVDPLPGHIGFGDAGQPGDLRWDWLTGLVQLVEGVEQAVDPPAGAVLELEDPELDHLVGGEVGAGGFHVDDQADESRLVGRFRMIGQRLQPAQHAVVARAFEHGGDAVEGLAHVSDDPGLVLPGSGTSACELSPKA